MRALMRTLISQGSKILPPFWLKCSMLLILWGLVFFPVYPELWNTWISNSNNSHGVLVPLISGCLLWLKRDELVNAQIDNFNWGGLILVMSLIVYLLALGGQVAVLQRAMIVVSLVGLVLYNFGVSVFKITAFPLLYLVFMIPVPLSIYSVVAFPLQLFATDVSRFLIAAVNIPVLQEGNMLYFAQAQLEVAEACSGLRSMTAFVMLGVLFASFIDKSWLKRGLLVLSAIPLAIGVNIFRVSGTGILAHFYGGDVARGFLHGLSGFAVFVVGFVLMLFLYVFLNRSPFKKVEE